MIDYGTTEDSDWIKLPKVGEPSVELHIEKAERIDDPEYKYNFMKNEPVMKDGVQVVDDDDEPVYKQKNQGFRYVFTLTNGKKFSISSWKPFFAFKEADVQEGDRIKVSHPVKGEWKVEKLQSQEEVWDGS